MASSRQKKKAKKHVEEEERKDRLSDLPDSLLLHILSLLTNIKYAVRTSVLSKRWKCLWASLPVLIFDNYDYGYGKNFKKVVRRVLSRRNKLPVIKFYYCSWSEDKSLITRIINYLASQSHNLQHLSIGLLSSFSILLPVLNRCRSLKTLEVKLFRELELLGDINLPTLTKLHLFNCSFVDDKLSIDPLINLVNLKSLQLESCCIGRGGRNFKISVPQLHSLTVKWLYCSQDCKVEIFAPKLHSFKFLGAIPVEFPNLDFPLLEIADIDTSLPYPKQRFAKSNMDLFNMFQGLYHAQSLHLSYDTIKVLMLFPDVLECQASPFVRLKTLTVRLKTWNVRARSNLFNITHKVMNYFLSGSTVDKDIRIKIEGN